MVGSLLLIAAVLAVNTLAIDLPAVPTWPSGRCTDKSLTIPSWIISKYKVSNGTTTFRVDNRAADPTGLIADVECTPDGACHTSGIDEIHGSISQSPNGPVITLSEIWVCGDAGDKVFFTATSNTTITQCVTTDCVSPIPYLVHGTLSLPLPLTPAQPSPPSGYNAATCASVGNNQWTVTDVSFQNYTDGQCKQWYDPDQVCLDPTSGWASKGMHFSFKVKNNAINYEITCSFLPTYQNYLPPSPLRCAGGDFNEITLDVTLSGTFPNFGLKIEQLWYCLESPSTNVNSSVIIATGNTSLQLNCSSTTGITGIVNDVVTICTNSNQSIAIDGVQTAKQILPAFSLVTAYPVHGGCTFDSVVSPTWYMRGLLFETNQFSPDNPNNATLSRFSCGLTGPGFADYFFYQFDTLSGSGINTVYSCNYYYDGKPTADHWNCSYTFDPFQKVLTLDKVWQCNDKDAAHPLYFDGSGSFDWKKDPNYTCNIGNTSVSCSWHDSLSLLQPGIPYDIPKITTSLVNVQPARARTIRVNGLWSKLD